MRKKLPICIGLTVRRSLLFSAAFAVIATPAFSQVFTRILSGSEEQISDYHPFHLDIEPPLIELQPADLAAALLEDETLGITAPRFGVKMETQYSAGDGLFFDLGDYVAWKIGFTSSASSLNFMMSGFNLPEGGSMYIYGLQKRMLIGPVEPRHIYGGMYATDIIKGGQAVIEIIFPKEGREEFSITIDGITQGMNVVELRGFGDSGTCNIDVNCPLGNGWEDERDAAVMILLQRRGGSQAHRCSGVMVNNACQDLRPFLLTAFHCLTGVTPNDFVYRFNYDSPDPLLPDCRGSEPRTWITYTGSLLHATHFNSDFALLELNAGIVGNHSIALAGWDRSVVPSPNGVSIHHPNGDVKKVSSYINALISIDNTPNVPGNQHWRVLWDEGVTEVGSSGSPIFNIERRAVGVLSGGPAACDGENLTDFYGRFHEAWVGIGNWLGAGLNPMSVNTIRAPFISTGGSNFVCTSNKTFVLENPVPGRAVAWSVAPVNLFASDGGASTSGTGLIATLRALDNQTSGTAVLTYLLTAEGCDEVEVSVPVWAGKPGAPGTSPSGASPIQMGVGDTRTVYLSSAPGARTFAADWTAFGAVSKTSPDWPTPYGRFYGDYEGIGNWMVSTENDCGASPPNFGQFNVSGGCDPCQIVISNNPVQDVLFISVPDHQIEAGASANSGKGRLRILDHMGRPVLSEEMVSSRRSINVSDLVPGLYVLHINIGGRRFVGKVIKIK
jgi:hypothetical protein